MTQQHERVAAQGENIVRIKVKNINLFTKKVMFTCNLSILCNILSVKCAAVLS